MPHTGLQESDFIEPNPAPFVIAMVAVTAINYGFAVLIVRLKVQQMVKGGLYKQQPLSGCCFSLPV